MKILDSALFAELSAQAKETPRLRKNYNLHSSYEEPCQRLLNAMEPGSYIRPHRHLAVPKPECFVGLRGRMALVLFDDAGTVQSLHPFGPHEKNIGADIEPGTWHTVVCLEAGSVFFETKPGPYRSIDSSDLAPWAPAEGSPEVECYLGDLVARLLALGKD